MKRACLLIVLAVIPALAQDAASDEWKARLQATIRQFQPFAVVTVKHRTYVYRYHTEIATIHQFIGGALSKYSYDEEVPKDDGVLITVTIEEGGSRQASELPQLLRKPHWTTFTSAYQVEPNRYALMELTYGHQADTNLIDGLRACFGTLSSSATGAFKRVTEKAKQPARGN